MFLMYLGLSLLLLVLWVFYAYYYWPIRQMKRYKELFQKHGYTACIRPFVFLGLGMMKQFKQGQKVHKDALYFEKNQYSKYDVNIANALGKVMITIVNPDLMKQFLSPETNAKYPKLEILVRGIREVLGNGIAFSEGVVWKNKRKIISKAFNFELLKQNIPKIVEICNKCFDQFDSKSQTSQGQYKYNVLNLSIRLFNGVMLKCFFGCDQVDTSIQGKSFEEFMVKMINDASLISISPLILLFGKAPYDYGVTKEIRDVKEAITIFRTIAGEVIKKRAEEVDKEKRPQRFSDIIQSLVYQRQDTKKKNETLEYSDRDLIDQFSTFLIGGTDTTSRFFTMIVYYLSQYPEIEKRLRKNIDEVIKTDEDITYQNLKKLTYIDWIQNETTRCYGPGAGIFPRVAAVDNKILQVSITKGTVVTYQSFSNHFSEKYFKDAFAYRPERWQKQYDNLHPYAFVGFSGGPRNCLGKQLAHLQSKIAIIKLIKRYKTIKVPNPDITLCSNFLYEPSEFETVFTK